MLLSADLSYICIFCPSVEKNRSSFSRSITEEPQSIPYPPGDYLRTTFVMLMKALMISRQCISRYKTKILGKNRSAENIKFKTRYSHQDFFTELDM